MKTLLYTTIMILIPCFGVWAQSSTENYIKTTTYTAPSTGVITENDTIVNVTYFDGLGRARQSVAVRGGGNRLDHNLIPWRENWALGTGATPFFNNIGQAFESEREMGTDPFGNTSMLWKCGNDPENDPDGGWVTDYFAIDNTVGYRYTVWIKRTGGLSGHGYHGTWNVNNLDGTENTNPYFWVGDPPQLDQWYLLVGVVHPYDYASGDTGVSGVYDTQGNKVLDGTEFKWDAQSSVSRFRNFLYYSTDTNVKQYFYNPVLQKLDGTEASIDDIIFERGAPDVITPVVYDNFGRQAKEYLPYAAATQNGNIHPDPMTEVANFYNARYGATPNPYSEKILENSPLNRVLEQGAPGAGWLADPASDTDHTIKFGYDVNTAADQVQLFEVSLGPEYSPAFQNSGFYEVADLYKTVIKDENWQPGNGKLHTTEEFTDKQGRVVLKRSYNNSLPSGEEAHDTYYVYDKFGSLAYVIPPKVDTSDGVSQEELNELCYQYRYDYRRRLVEKKLPGKGWEYIVYNKLDLPVLTQDANLLASGQWLFTKYDKFKRVIYTGIFSSADSRETLQNAMNAASGLYEDKTISPTNINGKDVYYTNQAVPDSNQEILTINYYDNYDFDLDGGTVEDAYGISPTTETRSLATGSKTRVLGTDQWITTVTYYDEKARPVYTYTRNPYLSTTDKVKYRLDFTGKVLETTTIHTKDGLADITTIEKFSYDRMGRLLRHTHQMAGQAEETLAENVYDALGQLVQKNVGNTSSAPLQTVDYSYNIRGWLTGINDVDNIGKDLFSFAIRYNNPTGGTPLYNGNISQSLWRTANIDASLKDYTYSYDALNRITGAIDNTGNYNLSSVSYDKNGNILSLNRQGHINEQATNFGVMDNLVYSYDSGNKLLRVEDTANDTYGFKDDAVAVADNSDDYSYDDNGNMIADTNKGITAISYNHLNLPEQVTINGENMLYIYDASGIKLQKVAAGTTTDYTGSYIYENSSLKFINHPEGYIEPDGTGGYAYVYQYKDYLGNIRLSYTDTNGDGVVNGSEIIEESNYYPFGLRHRGYNGQINGTRHPYTYNGKEEQQEFDLNWIDYGARNYDAALGRWMNVDPLAEDYYSYSTYNYTLNNPVFFIDPDGRGVTDIFFINLDGSIERVEQEGDHQYFVQNQGTTGEYQSDYTLVGTLSENANGLVEFPATGDNHGRYGTDDAGGTSTNPSENVGEGDHYVTPETAAALYGFLNALANEGLNIDLGDMSSSNGSDPWQSGFDHHSGHGHNGNRSGLDIDFRYLNNNGESFQSENAFNNSSFSETNNQTVYDTAETFGFTINYQGTSGNLNGPTQATGHNDHGHIGRANNISNITNISGKPTRPYVPFVSGFSGPKF